MIAYEGQIRETSLLGVLLGSDNPSDLQSQGRTLSWVFVAGPDGGASGFLMNVEYTGRK